MASDPLDQRVLQSQGGAFFSSMSPQYAAFCRSIVLAVGLAVVEGLISFFTTGDAIPPSLALYAPIILVVLRTIEGAIDQHSLNKSAEELKRLRAGR